MLKPGEKYNYLTILERIEKKDKKEKEYKYKCKCDCGKIIEVVGSNVKRGNTKSCGCYWVKKVCKISKGYRKMEPRLYNIYQDMKQRCYYKKSPYYKYYGGRGIKMCDEWISNYETFYNWAMNNGYQKKLTIDRINVNGNYEPSNCRWATRIQQQNNTTTNRLITYNGETKTLAEWARKFNFSPQKLLYRINNWGIEKAFNK